LKIILQIIFRDNRIIDKYSRAYPFKPDKGFYHNQRTQWAVKTAGGAIGLIILARLVVGCAFPLAAARMLECRARVLRRHRANSRQAHPTDKQDGTGDQQYESGKLPHGGVKIMNISGGM
jgi:hypothetical protein